MTTILLITQIVVSVLLIIAVLLQTSAEGLGGAFGGGDSGGASGHTRRGAEKFIFRSTFVLAILFAVISFVIFIISK